MFLSLIAETIFDKTIIKDQASPDKIISNVMPLIWFVAVGLAVIYIAYGGFQYTTSNGDGNKISEAKTTILNGVIGLVVILLMGAIFRYILGLV